MVFKRNPNSLVWRKGSNHQSQVNIHYQPIAYPFFKRFKAILSGFYCIYILSVRFRTDGLHTPNS